MSSEEIEWLEVGTITSPQGLKGELRVYPDSDFPERFIQAGKRWVRDPKTSQVKEVQLRGGRYIAGKNLYVIKLEGVESRETAEEFRDYELLVDKSDRPKLKNDEYHVSDLVGLEVYHQETQENLGVVIDLYSAGNDLLEIQLHKQPELEVKQDTDLSQISRRSKRKKYRPKSNKPLTIFIPFVREIVPIVDISNNKIEISPPDGLINIHETKD
ncbi:ribosome maturation factor RimM [Waterburya agarophytonicola K14]|uniref:Ribosome maturation factor RimM n=1 Tax=Waterburya agarophytonicola KI4 TaxID=2874699 RepID=A0A964BS30_9CYAN|nr:ribosome maturation factor RimM [Waterburya agarophytonicola]MCC0177211.1 ribosome maturation factor RimM [Waterburya agarophytonicola KI4]